MRPVLPAALLAALAIAACGGDDENGRADRSPGSKTNAMPSRAATSRPDRETEKRISAALRNYFGGGYGQRKRSWYGDIKSIRVKGDVATVRTSLPRRAKRPARLICLTVIGSEDFLNHVRVTGRPQITTLKRCAS
jgi:hypothetical protein